MMLYGVRFLLNLFEMLIYRRFLEAYIGNRRTGLELSVLIMVSVQASAALSTPWAILCVIC